MIKRVDAAERHVRIDCSCRAKARQWRVKRRGHRGRRGPRGDRRGGRATKEMMPSFEGAGEINDLCPLSVVVCPYLLICRPLKGTLG